MSATSATTYNLSTLWRHQRYYLQCYNQRVLQSVHTGAIGHTTYNMSALWRHRCYYLHYVHTVTPPAVLPTICPHRDATGATTYNYVHTVAPNMRYYLQSVHTVALLPTICPQKVFFKLFCSALLAYSFGFPIRSCHSRLCIHFEQTLHLSSLLPPACPSSHRNTSSLVSCGN